MFESPDRFQWVDFLDFLRTYDLAASVIRTPRGLPRHHLRVPGRLRARGRDLRRADRLARPRGERRADRRRALRGDRRRDRRRAPRHRHRGPHPDRRDPQLRGRGGGRRSRAATPRTATRTSSASTSRATRRATRPRSSARRTRSPPRSGLGCTVHAGEHAGRRVGPGGAHAPVTRLSHGVRAVEDPALVQEIVERGIVLEAAPRPTSRPTSSTRYEAHPLRKLHEAGVNLTLGSDDPPYFGCSIGGEYAVARERFGFEEGELRASRARRSGRPSRTMRPKPPCSIELLPQTTAPANRVAARRSNRKGVPAVRRPLHFIALLAMLCSLSLPRAAPMRKSRRPAAATPPPKRPRPRKQSRSAWSPTSAV